VLKCPSQCIYYRIFAERRKEKEFRAELATKSPFWLRIPVVHVHQHQAIQAPKSRVALMYKTKFGTRRDHSAEDDEDVDFATAEDVAAVDDRETPGSV
jgi:hypothetical protein